MGVGSGGKARRRQEKTYRKNGLSRSRRTVFTHSHMGACSCYFAVASLAVLATFFFGSRVSNLTGGLGGVAVLLAFGGMRSAMDGFRERDKNYMNCKVGIAANIVILLFLIVVFIIGCL